MKQAIKSLLLLSSVCALVLSCSTVAKAQAPVEMGQYVYANDDVNGPNTVEIFKADSAGVLTAVGSPVSTGGSGIGGGFFVTARATVASVGTKLFVSNAGDGSVSVFRIDPATGNLSLSSQGPVSTGGSGAGFGIGLALSPDGKFLYAGNGGSNNITTFTVSSKGTLAKTGPLVSTNGSPDSIMVTRDGNFLLETEPNNFDIGVFPITAGALGTGVYTLTSGSAAGIDEDCAGKHIFVGDASFTMTIEVFTPGSTLTPISGSPFNFNYGNANSNGVILSQDARYLYVSNQGKATVTSLKVDQTTGAVSGFANNKAADGVAGQDDVSGLAITALGNQTNVNAVFTGDFSFAGTPTIGSLVATHGGMLVEAAGGPFAAQTVGAVPLSVAAFPTHVCH